MQRGETGRWLLSYLLTFTLKMFTENRHPQVRRFLRTSYAHNYLGQVHEHTTLDKSGWDEYDLRSDTGEILPPSTGAALALQARSNKKAQIKTVRMMVTWCPQID